MNCWRDGPVWSWRRTIQQVALAAAWACLPSAIHAQGLEQLIAAAVASHPSAQVQQELVGAARASVSAARWQYFPTPSVSVERSRASANDFNFAGDPTVATLRLQQPVWNGGRLAAGVDKAKANLVATRASLGEVRQQLALRVVQAYGDWLAAHLKARASAKSLATHERLLGQVGRRIAQGASPDSDSVLAQGRLLSLQADLSLTRAQLTIALGRFEQLLGRPVDPVMLASIDAPPRLPRGTVESAVDEALTRSPTMQRALAVAEIRQVEVTERRAALMPEVFVRAERQYGNASTPQPAPVNRVFLGVSSSLGAGLSAFSAIDAAKAQAEAALADVRLQARTITDQVLAEHALVSSARERMASLELALQSSQSVSESFDRQFLAGRKTWLDVMNAARELAQTESQLAETRSALIVAGWRLDILTLGLSGLYESRR